jgi:hypothetical protein
MKRNILIIVAVVVLGIVGLSLYNRQGAQLPADSSYSDVAPTTDTPDAIDKDLGNIDTGAQLEADFEGTSQDIQKL